MDFKKYDIKTPQDLMKYFKTNMKYGFVYRNKIFTENEPDFQRNMDKFYKLRLKEDFLNKKYGVCWDFCECEREFFEFADIPHRCFFIESFLNRKDGGPTHTFALYSENNRWFWFEYAWQFHRGIHEYNSIGDALRDIIEKFAKFYQKDILQVRIYEFSKLRKRVNTFEFVEHCITSNRVLF